jgi:hypothetical protein
MLAAARCPCYRLTAAAIKNIERGTAVIGEEGRVSDELPSQIDRSFQRSLLLWMRDKYPSMAYKVPTLLTETIDVFTSIYFTCRNTVYVKP